ncbi:MAG: SpoIIIAH-like family protein [Lachnospiraceae bacterium]|nr:SpoIIIAH-like family protein [Lachnospiraceae bacterium]
MKKMFKKNQVIITALAIMIAVAGYLNFSSESPVLNASVEDMQSEGASGNSDDDIVSASVDDEIAGKDMANSEQSEEVDGSVAVNDSSKKEESETDVEDVIEDTLESQGENGEDVAEASLNEDGEPIDSESVGEAVLTNASITLSQAKLNREQTRSKAKEMILEIINSESLSEDAKKDAVNKMISMTEQMEKETAAETQLAAKGFQDAIVSISEGSVDVTISKDSLTDTQRTQIEDIIMRKTGCELENIVITTTQE